MVISEIATILRKQYRKTFSDADFYIRKVGTNEEYTEAVDRLNSTYEYEETDRKIETDAESESTI